MKGGPEGIQALAELVVVKDRNAAVGVDRAGNLNPGFASAVFGYHREFDRHGEPMDADDDGENSLGGATGETIGQEFLAPDVLSREPFDDVEALEVVVLHGLRPKFETENGGRGKKWGDLIVARLRGWNDRLALLVKQGWKEEKFGMF